MTKKLQAFEFTLNDELVAVAVAVAAVAVDSLCANKDFLPVLVGSDL